MKDKVLVIIPAFNEEKNIERVVGNLVKNYPELDYVVVSDGSTDRTAEICEENGYRLIRLPVNLGLAGCFQTGMKYAWEKEYACALVRAIMNGNYNGAFICLLSLGLFLVPSLLEQGFKIHIPPLLEGTIYLFIFRSN